MIDTLNKKEIKKLAKLSKDIQVSLSCDINGAGIPCRTDRLQAVKDMIKYILIHGYNVRKKNDNIYNSN
tara:strand:+ start:45 stop:251 length:207 start_codon:yes stop_codon:yes gene_type:complete